MMTRSSPSFVICMKCGTQYPAMVGFEHSRQALGCASYIRNGQVFGAYGSRVLDMEVADFVSGADLVLSHGEICDCCIEGLMESGQLVVRRQSDQEPEESSCTQTSSRMSCLNLPCFSASQHGGIAMEYALIGALVSITLIPGMIGADVGRLFNTASSFIGIAVTEAMVEPSGEVPDQGSSRGPKHDPNHQACARPNPPKPICG